MKIPLFKNYSNREDTQEISKIIKSGRNWAIGEKISEFENKLSEYLKVKYSLVFNSGTSALHALMITSGIKPNDEVIVPSFSFISTANSPLFVGAKPVFADIKENTFGLDYKDVEKKITKHTKAILTVHYGGCSCQINKLKNIARHHRLLLLEDAAESLGSSFKNKKVGSFGAAAIFSFCGPKVISTGEGGALVTNSRKIYEQAKLIRSHGRLDKSNYFSSLEKPNYVNLGYNFRMSNLAASLGVTQLKKIEKIISLRQENALYLNSKLSTVKEIIIPEAPPGHRHIYQMYTIRIKSGKEKRDKLKKFLNEKGVSAKIYFDPIHLSNFYKNMGYDQIKLPITEKMYMEVLTLPMYPDLTKTEMDYIIRNIKKFFQNEKKRSS
ncbi:MAG: aminotransferase DegT [Candidatus Liptonbacteria bacterium RIFOXYC1_FULL_36_8]|uniref:Aminotransferase DegT n=3 Tax=Candidatus Liptoniibacteriota TaxID=1817909 RepID=A0A1G2CNC6_9BACT|nr:MAG: aminotransferase DegT [Candidatus Liptonbacteria bacterium RIFOXYB1_FULL_36_10]OGZ03474.1 MAG: aminotransferase DegT [Candidatus Liptonbacteria bacterium RIFOXYD1_FULL_36_11]OGZ03501.1 MAG: aminotransferase DegT [Candidatus Liptonbacteria bacterium RIFOXYC1_FULL_36_8]